MIEAEMCAFNELLGRIDEFWRLSEAKTGQMLEEIPRDDTQSTTQTTESQISNATCATSLPAEAQMHLILVFFDIIYLNGESMMRGVYSSV